MPVVLLPLAFFLLSAAPFFRALKGPRDADPNQVVIIALQRRSRRKSYIVAIAVMSVILAITSPGGVMFVWVGILSMLLVGAMYGHARLDQGYFLTTPNFLEAARQVAKLGSACHVNHPGKFLLRVATCYRGISAPQPFLVIDSGVRRLLITPRRYWTEIGGVGSTAETASLSATAFQYTEQMFSPRKGDVIYGKSWIHATKSGDRDFRFKDNRQVFEVLRWGIEIHLRAELRWQLGGMRQPDCESTLAAFNVLFGTSDRRQQESSASEDRASNGGGGSRHQPGSTTPPPGPRPWHDVLGVSPNATKADITAARNKLAKQYHPDRIKGVENLGPDFEIFANQKLIEINTAYEQAVRAVGK